MIMTYTEFLSDVIESIKKMGFEAEIRKFPHGDAVTIRSDIDDRYSPVIYPQRYYDDYSLEKIDSDEEMIIGMIGDDLRHYFELLKENMPESSYNKAINHIIPKFVSKETAENYPDRIVKIPYLDFCIVFIYVIDKEGSNIISYPIDKDMLSDYGVDEHQLLMDAIKTDEKLMKADVEHIEDFLGHTEPDPKLSFTVLTNTPRIFGATAILYKDLLKNYAEKIGTSFSIIPSSIHEVLLIPDSMKIPVNELQDMLHAVNSTLVEPSERLGSHIYRYDIDTGISVA